MRALALACCFALLLAAPARADDELPCRVDEVLGEVAASLLLAADEPDADRLAAALREAGSDLPAARLFRGAAPDLAPLRRHADGPLVCGEAEGARGRLLVVAVRGGSLAPLGDARFRVEVEDGFEPRYVAWVDAEGRMDRAPVRAGAVVTVPEELAHPIHLQLVAAGPAGPRPVAERVVGESSGAPLLASDGTLAERLEALRAHHGASSLRPNRLLDAEARRHAGRLCRERRAVHTPEPGEDPTRRLRRRGIEARVVGEVVVRARSEDRAF
ncbi:MAG TPA: hypothetical protein RMG95_17815, partial [Polyangiaceae bacterium LLY-WYZ-15_(1-7)]|nr:hypothetical protein [Polyangiaceae bacterium LLY-WYZ-15_(1-7)]